MTLDQQRDSARATVLAGYEKRAIQQKGTEDIEGCVL